MLPAAVPRRRRHVGDLHRAEGRRGHRGAPQVQCARVLERRRAHHISIFQYIGEICRYLLNQPVQAGEREHSLRCMLGAGLSPDTWQRWVERFGPIQVFEGWGATEANTNVINVDNYFGSCGRVPDWNKTNLRLVRYDVENDCHPRDENGFYQVCEVGEVGEAMGFIIDHPEIGGGRFEGYTSARPPRARSAAMCSARAMPTGARVTCCARTPTATSTSSTASATPSAGRARTFPPWKWRTRWAICRGWN